MYHVFVVFHTVGILTAEAPAYAEALDAVVELYDDAPGDFAFASIFPPGSEWGRLLTENALIEELCLP